jgi:protein O-mannosyl-transferase
MSKKHKILSLAIILIIVSLVYSNHFNNPFHFDDTHTIVNNPYIKDINNFGMFFTDVSTFSTMPTNQGYRPIVTLSLAIDYWIAGDLNPFYFHLSMFFWFLVQLILMYYLFRKILEKFLSFKYTEYFILFAISFYGLHAVNAETINYIISRSDSMSTVFVILGIVLYAYFPAKRKYYLYLIPVILAILTKQTAVMFAPIIALYILFFEMNKSISDLFGKNALKTIGKVLYKSLPSIIICGIFGYLVFSMQRKEAMLEVSNLDYMITQSWVMLRYFILFFIPVNLSADPDWTIIDYIFDERVITGFAFVIILFVSAVRLSKNELTRPISFGIFWFFLALLPTSSFIALTQVTNDHRMFFPFVGLTISAVGSLAIIAKKYDLLDKLKYRYLIICLAVLVLGLNAYGTYMRNIIWSSSELLWYDVTEKSPNNPRGLMNYGLSQMEKGNYDTAKEYFEHGLKIDPDYFFLHINMGILLNAMGNPEEAEQHFLKTLKYTSQTSPTYYYASFLKTQERFDEAIIQLKNCLSISYSYMPARHMLMELYLILGYRDNLISLIEVTLELFPSDKYTLDLNELVKSAPSLSELDIAKHNATTNPNASNFINLSLAYYKSGMYLECIDACKSALELDPENALAYNNMCSAYTMLGEYDKAIEACNNALQIKPDYELAKNNLNKAISLQSGESEISLQEKIVNANPSSEGFLNLSLLYYKNELYQECIDACYKALVLKPDYAEAYNNICSAYNKLGEYDKAVDACNKALEIRPDFERAKNNLAHAKSKMKL